MPASSKTTPSTPSGGGSAPKKNEWVMPVPSPIVLWKNAVGGEVNYAVVTKVNRYSVNVMIFPSDSRVGVPKDGVRHVSDPHNDKNGINADSGVWEYTTDYKLLLAIANGLDASVVGGGFNLAPEATALLAKLTR